MNKFERCKFPYPTFRGEKTCPLDQCKTPPQVGVLFCPEAYDAITTNGGSYEKDDSLLPFYSDVSPGGMRDG